MKAHLIVGLGMLVSGAALAQENFVVNGDFEAETQGWSGMKTGDRNGKKGSVPAPELISWEQKDTYNKSSGALKVTWKSDPQYEGYSHSAGAVCTVKPPIAENQPAKVTFYAKAVEGGNVLSVQRLWGGDSATVRLSDHWEKYEMVLRSKDPTSGFVFGLVGRVIKSSQSAGAQRLVEGVFLLDEVSVVLGDQ